MQEVRSAIGAAHEKVMEAFRQADAAAIAAPYTEQAKLLPPNSEMLRGREAVESFWRAAIDMGIKEATLETVELDVHGTTACEIGQYTLRIEAPGGGVHTDRGKYVVIWKHEDGGWKMDVDIWNTSAGASTSASTQPQ